jgi:Arylsulfotransferase (ASST)
VADQTGRRGLTRRQVLRGAGGAAALALAGGGLAGVVGRATSLPVIESFPVEPAGRVRAFHSRPDLRPPTVATKAAHSQEALAGADPGYLFLGPGPVSLKGSEQFGPLIVDSAGRPVWFRPLAPGLQVTNFARWRYRGEPVLVWWEGKIEQTGYGQGEVVVVNRAYRELARVRAAGGRSIDLHALAVTPQGTALFTCYPDTVPMDLSSIGGPRDSQVRESIIQEVDIASGRMVFEWRSLQHIPVSASREPMGEPYDYLHVNSVQQLPDGNLLISARHAWALYKIERRTGKVIWTLGGKHSQFDMGPGTGFSWQHDALLVSDQMLTLFDNGTNGPIKTEHHSRGVALEVDETRRKVTLAEAYVSSHKLVAGAMGSVQILPSDRVMVGWGVASYTSKFTSTGELLSEFALPAGMYSYRGLWLPWEGAPHHRPKVTARRDRRQGTTTLYASWNGATEVTDWQVEAGPRHDQLLPLGIATSHGFETVIPLRPSHRYAAVTALDRFGRRLKRSQVIKL